MIGKIKKGASFGGCVKYVMCKDEAKLLDAQGVLLTSIKDIIGSFELQRSMRPTIKQPVGHIALSYKTEDAPRLTDRVMAGLAREYMVEMGIADTQYIIVRHHDTDNPHVHLVYNRIDFSGKLITSQNDFRRNEIATKKIKEKYGLAFGDGKDRVNIQKLNAPDRTKYEIYHAVKALIGDCSSWDVLVGLLWNKGIDVEFKTKGHSTQAQGITFIKDGLSFKGSQVDRAFSFAKLDAQIKQNAMHGQQHYTHAESQTERPQQQSQSQQSQQSHAATPDALAETVSAAIGGLFDIPIAPSNGTDPEEEEFRRLQQRKKKKRGFGMR